VLVADLKEKVRKELEEVVGAHNVSCSESVRQQHGQDEGPHRGNTLDLQRIEYHTQGIRKIQGSRNANNA